LIAFYVDIFYPQVRVRNNQFPRHDVIVVIVVVFVLHITRTMKKMVSPPLAFVDL
jgi:hypothetical protein